MWTYTIGLSLLLYGSASFKRTLQSYDPPILHTLCALGNIFTVIYFVVGFFVFPWYAPLLGIIVLPFFITAAAHALRSSTNFIILLKDHLSVITGFVMCTFSFFI